MIDWLPKDFVVLPGGSDVNPAIYGKKNLMSYINKESDAREIAMYKNAIKSGKPILGICKGSQMLAALNGLTLIQDMDHPGQHNIKVKNNSNEFDKEIFVNSTHHQCVWTNNKLLNDNYEVFGYTKLSKQYVYDDRPIQVFIEPEIIWYPKANALGVQFHPENMRDESYNDCIEYLKQLINKLF